MKVVFVQGPSASGKSDLAFALAQKTKGVIVNCDSIQCYQGLDIGSAKPPQAEREKVPHYLYDFVPKGEVLTAGAYARTFFDQMETLKDNTEMVFVVGGSGFYFQAIEKGMYAVGAVNEDNLQAVEADLAEHGGEALHSFLATLDPESARKISAQDHYRLVRALEMIRTHGKTPSQVREEFQNQAEPFPYPLLKIGMTGSREVLLPRVQARTRQMLKLGLLEEVRGLLKEGLKAWAPLQSVGYKECVEFLQSEEVGSLELLSENITQATLRLCKKQRTWFSRDKEIYWDTPLKSGCALTDLVLKFQNGS